MGDLISIADWKADNASKLIEAQRTKIEKSIAFMVAFLKKEEQRRLKNDNKQR